jgi:hypothetical protein
MMNMATQEKEMQGIGYDPAFGQLDLSGFPHLMPLHDETFADDRFAQGHKTHNGAADLRAFLAEQVNEQTPTSVVHAGGCQFRVSYHDGAWHADGDVNGARRRFTDADREALLGKLGQIAKQNPYRELTESQKLEVIRLAQSGDRLSAIGTYLKHSIGEAGMSKYNSPIEAMYDPALVPIMSKCAEFVWFHSNSHAVDSPEWHAYKDRVLAGRPVTIELLQAIWMRWQVYLEDRPAPQPQADEPEDVLDLNDLSDEEIETAYKATVRASARSAYR